MQFTFIIFLCTWIEYLAVCCSIRFRSNLFIKSLKQLDNCFCHMLLAIPALQQLMVVVDIISSAKACTYGL